MHARTHKQTNKRTLAKTELLSFALLVTLTGTSLLGNGSRLVSAILVGVPAIIKKQTNNNVVLEAGAYATNLSTSGPVVLTSDNGAMVTSSLRWTYIASGHIDVVTPSEGQFGSLVNISGTNLLGGGENISIVTLCGLQAKVVFISFNLLVVRAVTNLKRDLPGDVIITANTGARVIGIHKWIYRKQGIITNISPVTGQLGTLVTITGSNVLGYGSQILNITIAQVPVLSVVEQSSLRVVARVGAGAEGVSGNVIIFADTEAVVTSINLTFTFSKPGSISLVTPSSGLEGTLVVIRGTLLHGHGNLTSGVTLNGVPVSQIVYDSETEIIVAAGPTPLASPTQPGNVEITSNTGEIVTKDRIFSYATPVVISSVTPSSGQRGTVVNIALTIKSSAVEVVHVAGTEATVTQRKGNTVVIHLGRPSRQGTFTGDIVVTLQNGSKARRKSGFTYTSEGIIFSINPAQGQIGTIVKVTGQNLLGNGTQIVTASLAGLSGQVVNSSNTEALIVVTERNFIRNLGNLTLTSDNGAIITRVDGWESVPAGLIQSVFPNVGQLGTLVTIRGQRLFGGGTRINSVHLSGIPALRIMSANDSIVIVEAADGDNTTNQTSAVTLTSDTGSIVELQLGWIYKPRGKIVSVSPAIGQFGTHVTIKGYNLLGQGRTVQVSLGQVDALTVESATDTLIVVRANDGMNITGRRESIMITANTGAFTTRKATWTYRARGVITSVYPPNGQYGTEVVVRGLNLFGFGSKIVRATIGGIEASVMQNTNEIVVISAGLCLTSISDVDIILEADSGAQVIAQRVFSYITPGNITSVQPASGLHGTIITITGFQLFGYGIKLKSVSIAGTLAAFDHFAVNSSVITVTAGINAHPVTGPIVITSSSGAIVSYFNWTYVQGGIISALLPAVGRSGIRVTLSGSRLLSGGTTVKCIIVNGSPSFKIESANDTHIQFRLGPPPPAGQSQHGVSVVLTSGSMYSVTANLFAYTSDGGIVTSVNPNAGHGGTTVVIRGSNLLNGGNVSNIFLSGIKVAAILSANETVVVVVAGKGYDATGDVIVASFNGFISGLHNGWQYLPFIPKSAVSPAQGQSGTTVTISAHKALLNFKVKSVIIAGIPAQLQSTSVNRTYFDDRNMSIVEDIQQLSLVAGPLSTATTYTGDIVLQSQTGEQLLISRGWTYLPNQIVDFVSPINGYQGTQVTIIGRNLLAGGTRISSVHLAGISTRIMTEEIDFEGKNVLRVEVLPNKQTQSGISGNIVITSDDGASFVPPGRQWTYLDVQIASFRPKFGQVGTLVTVSGLNLLAGGNSILSATLAGVTATIVKASTSEVVLRANNSTPTGPDDIVLNMDTGAQILLHQGWTYSQPGNITEVQPRIGTEGTVVGITGTDLLGGGKQASNVFLDGVPAREVVASSHLYVEVVVGKGPPGGTTTPGTVIIIANTGATISRSNLFRYAAVGKVTSILPQLGQYGTEVIIRGSDLLSGSSSLQYVKLAGVDATVVGKPTDSMVTVRAGFPPRLDAFTDVIEIRSSSGGIVSSSTVKFSYLRSGQIYTVSPSKGQHGTYVHLAGERLLGGGSTLRAAYLGNVSAFIEKPFTDDSVTIRAGESVQTGNVNVTLVSDNGAIVVKLGFTYLQSSNITTVNPPIGRQGTRIRITGNRLTGGGNNITNVRLSGVQVMSFVEGTGYVDVRAGNGSKAVNLTGDIVITSNTGAQTTLRNGFTYTSPGRVSRLSPSSGISDEEVNITGVDLLGGGSRIVTVTFGSIKAQVIHSSNTSVTVITGPNNDGEPKPNIDVYLEADTGDATYAFGAWSYNASCTGNQFGLYPSNCTNCSAECNRCFNIGNTNCRRCQRFTIPTNSSNGKQCVFSCPNFINGTTCVDKCSKFQFVNISMDTDNKIHKYCYQCSSLCNPNNGCDGPNPTNCTVCLYVRDEGACTDKCPIDKYSDNENNCQPCHSECKKGFGCHGPNEWDCNVCAHFSLTRDTCNFTSTDATGNYCIASCPNDYFVNGSNCLECDDQCLGGCKGSLPHQCHHCAKYVKLQNGLHTCVASCNPESGPYLFYASTNRCERCHPQCSPIGGCTGPEPQDCLQCQNLTLRNTANGTTCVGQCPSKYYADEQFQCNTCDASCTNGCNGPTPSDCTATGTTVGTFDAGTGTVAVVVAICVVLLVIIVLVFVWACCKSSSDRYSVSDILLSSRHEEPSHDETDRQKQVKETSIDGRPPASLPSDHGGLRPLSEVPLLKKQSAVDNYIPMAVSNNAMTDEEYTAMDTPKLVADSVYADSDQPPPTASHQQPAHKSFSSVTLPPPVTQDMYDDVEVDQGELLYEDVNPAAAAKTSKNKARPMSQPSKSTPALLPSTKTKHTAPTLPPRSTKPQGALLPHPPRAQPPAEQPRKLGPKPGSSMQHLPPLQPMNHVSITATKPQFTMQRPEPGQDDEAPVLPPRNANKPYEVDDLYEDCSNIEID